ncbi:MAG TPA: iron-sulfur cluster insertion protein ErpA [Rhodospirillaceae bacterium]|nr:iron-sulfur cluster insertion protein ErpA [Alphaproteobacteria bacterium]OUT42420.1 MAG: iron-sulfur cluster assembly accessory protein [Micavibrio sp. TMED2]HCI46084.1 iron-sulfur cluster insertion protein ErpA [Rhodospirillaceae bacterium]MAS45940.1 iron-sulfur cluster insertion protein ErpA [Alphaproteobacteria bacterium]MAX95878.1 iron-sulfur cluster insertion protein ErpA [Alphaproteobacteria bacterium]|tara:strand:- start:18047 stop:18427 length:381 start_codon:yes stop_codon:yes gene_type:complete
MSETTTIDRSTAPDPAGRKFGLTDSAVKRIARLRELEGNPKLMMRVSVIGGGCSGFQYVFDFDETINDDDHIFEKNEISVLVDDTSLDLLDGAELDFKEDLVGQYFQVSNPNASSACGCGTSFSIA